MKKFLFIMTLLIAFCVPWAHGQTLFYEGFESTSGTDLPAGWTNEGDKTWTTALGVYNTHPSSAYAGSRNAQLYSGAYDAVTKLITPVIDCSSKSSVILTFAYVNQPLGADIDEIRVYYRISTADSWHQLENITSGHSSWTLSDEYTIPTSLSSTLQLAFECYSHWGYAVGIDEVTVMTAPTCSSLQSLYASDITRTSLTANWTKKAAATNCVGYEVKLSASSNPDDAGISTAIIDNPATTSYTFGNLERNTTYYVHARPNCGDEDGYGDWVSTSVKTQALEDCSATSTLTFGSSKVKYVPFGSYYNNYFTQQIYLASELQAMGFTAGYISAVSFQYGYSSSATKNIQVYLDNTDLSQVGYSNIPYKNTGVSAVSTTFVNGNWYEFPLGELFYWDGESNVVVTMRAMGEYYDAYSETNSFYGGTASGYMSLIRFNDDADAETSEIYTVSQNRANIKFRICETVEACPAVTNVAVSNIAQTTANLSWTASTGDYANTSDIYYSTTEVEDFTGVEPQVTGVTGNSAEITGLANYTTYYVYVRTHCDGEGQDDGISPWAGGTSFRTLSPCRVPGTPVATITGKHTATVAWTNTSEATQADNFTYILSATPIAEADLETASATASEYNDVTVDLTGLLSDTTYYFYVRNVCTGDVNCNSPWDSCQFTTPAALPAVINLQAYDIASNAFTAVWESDLANFADETAWEVACVADGETPTTWTEVSAPEYFAIGLTQSTNYDFYVRAKDGENYSANAKVDVTTTAVPADCKTIGDGTGTSYGPICGFYGFERNIYLFYPEDGLSEGTIDKIAWQYSTANMTIPAKIYLKNTTLTDLSSLYNGTFSNAIDGATLVYDASVTTVSGWLEIDITDFEYTGGNLMVLVASNKGGDGGATAQVYYTASTQASTHISSRKDHNYDDDTQSMSSATSQECNNLRHNIQFCFAPEACPSVTNLIVDNITTTSARAHWYPGNTETKWQVINSTVQMSQDAFDAFDAFSMGDTIVTAPQIALTDLSIDMDFYFYVRGICGEGDTSKWKEIHYITLPSCSDPATAVATSEADNSITFTVTAGEYGTAEDFIYEFWTVGGTDNVDRLLQGCGECHEISIGRLDTIICEPPCRAHRDTVVISGGNSVTVMVDPLKTYGWRVRANCGDPDDLSRWTYGNEVHVCGAATLPYSEDFKTLPTSSYSGPGMIEPICWNDLNAAAAGSYPSYSINPASMDGTYAIQFNSSEVTPIYMILPAIKDANECQVRFDCGYGNISYSGRIQVGYITDPTDETTFVPAFTDNPTSESYQSHRVNIFNIPDGARVAFCYTAGAKNNYNGLLKNVVLDTIPHHTVATSVAPELTPALGSIEVAYNEGDTLSEGIFFGGKTPVFTAVPNEGIKFINWTNANNGDTLATVNPWTITVSQDTAIVANFDTASYNLNVLVAPGYDILGEVAGSGNYRYGRTINYSATPMDHYSVVWPDGNKDNNRSIVMPGHDTTIVATFEIDKHQLTVAINDPTMGTVTGTGVYDYGTFVDITATPNDPEHMIFTGWSNGETDLNITIDLQHDSVVTANFIWVQHTITAVPVDTTCGTVKGSGVYNYGDTATLIAVGKYPYQFSRWDDENLTELDTFKVKVLGDASYTAYFKFNEFDVIARSADLTMGTVTGGGSFVYDTVVNVTAIPNEHYHFAHWNNGSVDPTTTVIVKFDTVLTAYFAIDQHVVTANANNYDYGTVAGASTYNYGASVTLTATAAPHYMFTGWSDGTTANPYTFTLEGDTTITAIFAVDSHTIAATANDDAMGSVSGAGEYVHGTLATLTATANEHYHFVNWSNGLTVNSFSILVDKDSTVTANFAIDQHVVTANANNYDYGTIAGAGTYNYGAQVTLTATAAPHYMFTGWSDGTTANPYTFTLEGDVNVTAIFIFADPITEYVYITYCDNETEGTKFEGYKAGVYDIVNTYTTAIGRDSIVDSVITILPTYNLSEYETIEVGKSLVWHGMTIVETTDGDYTYIDSAKTAAGCDSVTTLYLHVTAKTDVEVISDVKMPIVVAPNPIVTGMTTYVNHDWSEEEREGMFVEIIDNFGKVIDHFTPENFPIEVSGDMASGIYHIRVVTGIQDVYIEKLIVK